MHSNVLLVEDDQDVRECLAEILEIQGYIVSQAVDGLDALGKVKAKKPELILLDLMMPRMDGFHFIHELHRQDLRDIIPIIIVTAYTKELDLSRLPGVKSWIAKPFDVDDLLSQAMELTKQQTA